MNILNVLPAFSRLCLSIAPCTRSISTNSTPLCFQATNVLLGEPLKKKKRIDPAIIRMREERRRKKLEKMIRRLGKTAKQLKPIEEMSAPYKLIEEKERRTRSLPPLSADEIDRRQLLLKEWTRYKYSEFYNDLRKIDSIMWSQQKALDELRAESEELYNEAIQIDLTFTPYKIKGPVCTPPIENYDVPDGDYIDITRKFEGE